MKRQIAPRVLPNLLSDLIEVALADLEKAEASRRHRVSMSVWHDPGDGICEVCLAGSVIAFTLKEDPKKLVVPSNYDEATQNKLNALDHVRCGQISSALFAMRYRGGYMRKTQEWCSIPPYSFDPDAFKAALRTVAASLRERGL